MPAREPKNRFSFYDPHATKATVQDRPAAPAKTAIETPEAEIKPAEPGFPKYTTKPAWVDAAGRTRTWAMYNPYGTKLAEVTTKGSALLLSALLNRLSRNEREERSR